MRTIHWMRSPILALALVLGAGALVAATTADPVALLVKLQGDVAVERAGATDPVTGVVGMQLNVGDRVVVANGGEAVVLYRTGKMVKASAPVLIEQPAEAESSTLFSNTVRTLGQVATTDARTQPNRQGMIRPIAGAPVPISPRNGKLEEGLRVRVKVMDVRPTFTWYSVPNVESYMIQIHRQGPDSPRFVRYQVGSDTTWTLPAHAPALVPGATYVWSVGAPGTGRVAETQAFTVASAADIATVQQALEGLIAAGIDPASDGLFLAALAYRDAGLYYEAERALREIEQQGNASGRAYHMLRGDVYDALGDSGRAEASFQLADGAPEG